MSGQKFQALRRENEECRCDECNKEVRASPSIAAGHPPVNAAGPINADAMF
jgi:hypothetical protein